MSFLFLFQSKLYFYNMGKREKKIGVFDSGYGGLTILSEIRKTLPNYHYVYFGDNARAPYGTRSFEIVYQYTLNAVRKLFELDCDLVILACNTASAKALRNIQQNILPVEFPGKRVLGVIRPSAEEVGSYTKTGHVGILATHGTVVSESYVIEVEKFSPSTTVHQLACPLWVPLIENNEHCSNAGKEIIKNNVKELMTKNNKIDVIVLACTHYPIIADYIKTLIPSNVALISQGSIVANKLSEYLGKHSWLEQNLSNSGGMDFYTSESPLVFDENVFQLTNKKVNSKSI